MNVDIFVKIIRPNNKRADTIRPYKNIIIKILPLPPISRILNHPLGVDKIKKMVYDYNIIFFEGAIC